MNTENNLFLIFVEDREYADLMERILIGLFKPTKEKDNYIAVSPVRGLDFYEDENRQEEADEWWEQLYNLSDNKVSIFNHDEKLAEYLKVGEGKFYVIIEEGDEDAKSEYEGLDNVTVIYEEEEFDSIRKIIEDYSNIFDKSIFEKYVETVIYEDDDEDDEEDEEFLDDSELNSSIKEFQKLMESEDPDALKKFIGYDSSEEDEPLPYIFSDDYKNKTKDFNTPKSTEEETKVVTKEKSFVSIKPKSMDEASTENPWKLLQMSAETNLPTFEETLSQYGVVPEVKSSPRKNKIEKNIQKTQKEEKPYKGFLNGIIPKFPTFRTHKIERVSNLKLAQSIQKNRPLIIGVGSRKGGVGKTSFAAAISIIAGNIVSSANQWTALVDANIANPDAWGKLDLPLGAPTVQDTIYSLNKGLSPKEPIYAKTPGLVVFPENRTSAGYSRHEIDLFADFLKKKYSVIVVDLSNRLPDINGGPEAEAVAFWLSHIDILVLPTTHNADDFIGVLDYLDYELPTVVVAYIEPSNKRDGMHPGVVEFLEEIAKSPYVHEIAKIPFVERLKMVGYGEFSLLDADMKLTEAYRSLTETVLLAPKQIKT